MSGTLLRTPLRMFASTAVRHTAAYTWRYVGQAGPPPPGHICLPPPTCTPFSGQGITLTSGLQQSGERAHQAALSHVL